MTPETFRRWLADRGCTFEQHPSQRGGGVASITVRRGGRRAELYDSTSKMDLDPDEVRKIVDALDLDWRELPGPKSHEQAGASDRGPNPHGPG